MRLGRLVLSVVAAWTSNAGSAGAQRVTPDTIDVFQQLPLAQVHVYSPNVDGGGAP